MSNIEAKYPNLQAILDLKGQRLQPFYTTSAFAKVFDVSSKTIQNHVSSGKLFPRDLPGRAKYLAQDLEDYIKNSRKGRP